MLSLEFLPPEKITNIHLLFTNHSTETPLEQEKLKQDGYFAGVLWGKKVLLCRHQVRGVPGKTLQQLVSDSGHVMAWGLCSTQDCQPGRE